MDDIERELPELIDLLIATVEAGMGFTASLGLIAERLRGRAGRRAAPDDEAADARHDDQQALEEMATAV